MRYLCDFLALSDPTDIGFGIIPHVNVDEFHAFAAFGTDPGEDDALRVRLENAAIYHGASSVVGACAGCPVTSGCGAGAGADMAPFC